MPKHILVLAPHPDDETLGCGGTIVRKLEEGNEVFVVFMTDGRHALSNLGITENPTPSDMKEIRMEEAIAAAKILGLKQENLIFLNFDEKTFQQKRGIAKEKIVEIFQLLSPEEIFYPQAKEYHKDHRLTFKLVKEALEETGFQPKQHQYIIAWAFPFYILQHLVSDRVFNNIISFFQKRKIVRTDISKYIQVKLGAINAYKSQISLISSEQKKAVLKRSLVDRHKKTEEDFFTN